MLKQWVRLFEIATLVGAAILVAFPAGAQNLDDSCQAGQDGAFSCEVTIPDGFKPHEQNLVADCLLGSSGSAYPPSSAGSGSNTGQLVVSSNRVSPGQVITASGNGCLAGSPVSFRLEDADAVEQAQAAGTRRLTAVISGFVAATRSPGNTAAAPRGSLVRTGIEALPWLAGGLAALTVGGGLVLAGRRRIRRKSLLA